MQIFSKRTDKPHAYKFGEYQNPLAYDPVELAISEDGKNWVSAFDVGDMDGIYLYDYDWQTPVTADTYSTLGQRNGQDLTASRYDSRQITLTFLARCLDEDDEKLALKAVTNYLVSRTPYWITFADCGYRMYLVKYTSMTATYISEKNLEIEVVLNNLTGVGQSVVSSLNIDNAVAFGLGLRENENYSYQFSGNSFTVYNPGDVPVDPVVQDDYFVLTIHADGKPSIKNNDTGDTFTMNNNVNKGQSLVLNGVNPYLDGNGCGNQTNNGVIRLQQGENHLSVSGCDNFSCSIDFFFKYLN